jgi:hypothetical protein
MKHITKNKTITRLDQIIDWVLDNNTTYSTTKSNKKPAKDNTSSSNVIKYDVFDGCILFDECHRAKNLVMHDRLKCSKSGLAVQDLQTKLPNARIVYCSATGITVPKDMAYMDRLGLWYVSVLYDFLILYL